VNSLESLARVQVRFRQRPTSTLVFMESCELLHPPGSLTEPVRFAYASYLAELADRLTIEEQAVPELYALVEEGLSALLDGPATGAFLRGFELKLLVRAGYGPQLSRCHTCRRPLGAETQATLDLRTGRILCTECGGAERGPAVAVKATVLTRLGALKDPPLRECQAQSLGAIDPEAADLMGRFLELHLTRPLKSLEVIAQALASTKQPAGTTSASARACDGDPAS
jgi:DNA repair protein RecO (recombination protein O)